MTAKCLIRRYFYSGWVFLLPYTFVYTFFAWRRWPVDSVESSGSNEAVIICHWSARIGSCTHLMLRVRFG